MRKVPCLAYLILVSALAIPGSADEAAPKIYFKVDDASRNILVIERLVSRLDKNQNECSGSDCSKLYAFEYIGTETEPSFLPMIEKGGISARDSHTLELTLDKLPENLDALRLVLKRLKTVHNEEPIRMELMIAPSAFLDPDSRSGIVYRAIQPRKDAPRPETVTVKGKVTDEDTDVTTDLVARVVSVERYARGSEERLDGEIMWLIKVAPSLPRGRTVKVEVSGIDSFASNPITGKGGGKVEGFPKGRDDANYYLRGQYIFNQTNKDQGSVDLKIENHYFIPAQALDYWYKVEATVGSKSLDISQSGTVAAGRTFWFNVDPNDPKKTPWAFSVAPTFQTDRDFKNRDLGADLTLESKPGWLYQPLETKRREHPDDPNTFGWWIIPKLAIESGWHLASSSEEVDGKSFERGVASMNIMWERAHFIQYFATLRLTVDAAARYLVQNEVLSDSGDVVKTDKGYTPYLRAELAYDLGAVAVSIVHENGRLPPNFKRAHATTVGVTVKF